MENEEKTERRREFYAGIIIGFMGNFLASSTFAFMGADKEGMRLVYAILTCLFWLVLNLFTDFVARELFDIRLSRKEKFLSTLMLLGPIIFIVLSYAMGFR